MATNTERAGAGLFGRGLGLETNAGWAGYWVVMLRLITGWWFFHAGITKLMEGGLMMDATGWMQYGAEGTLVHPITNWFAQNAAWLPNLLIPMGETLIGLGLLVGCLTRLAAFFGAFLMAFFYVGNAGFGHGFVNGDLMGLLLMVTMIVFAAGRVLGIDGWLAETGFAKNHAWLRYMI